MCFSESLVSDVIVVRSDSEVSDVSSCSCVRFVPLARGQSVQTDKPAHGATDTLHEARRCCCITLNGRLLA